MTAQKPTIIQSNPTGTVGIISMYNPKDAFIAEVNPLLLKQWAELVYEQFQFDDVVYISLHKHPDSMNTVRHLSATEEFGDEVQVVLCGTDCDDVVKKGGVG